MIKDRTPPFDRLCWVVSLEPAHVQIPSTGPREGPPFAAQYALVFVEAQTGPFLFFALKGAR